MQAYLDQAGTQSPVHLHLAGVGKTRKWGHPVDHSRFRRYHLYPLGIWDHPDFIHPDLVLIDGRFREATRISIVETTLMSAAPGFDVATRTDALARSMDVYARLGTTQCRYSVDYADREVAKSRRQDCHATRFRDNFWIVDTSNSPGPDSDFWRHSDVFESCTGRADLRAFLMGRHDVPWRERLDSESYPDWQATPEWAGRVGWRLVDDPGLQQDGECVEWMPAGERTLSATN